MAIPEQLGQVEGPVQEVPESAEVPQEMGEATGVQAVPATPQPLQGDDNQTIAQPVPAPSSKPSITIPVASDQALEQMAKGKASDAKTWFGVFWLRKIKKAIQDGLSLIFGDQ